MNLHQMTFGRLTVTEDREVSEDERVWCRCACGNDVSASIVGLREGRNISCGCCTPESKPGRRSTLNLCGIRFTRLRVLDDRVVVSQDRVLCECECGNQVHVLVGSLTTGNTKSCGCLRPKVIPGDVSKVVNASKHPLYQPWRAMIARCYNPNSNSFKAYGARGISVDPAWLEFATFISDMGACHPGYSLERIDVNGNYTSDNCRWASLKEQNRNKTTTLWVTYKNEDVQLVTLAERLQLNPASLYNTVRAYLLKGSTISRKNKDQDLYEALLSARYVK